MNFFSTLHFTPFSSVNEIPRLDRWFRYFLTLISHYFDLLLHKIWWNFSSNQSPSRQKLHSYLNILNGSPFRRANNKVTYQQLCNWFTQKRRTLNAARNAASKTRPNAAMAMTFSSVKDNGAGDNSFHQQKFDVCGFSDETQIPMAKFSPDVHAKFAAARNMTNAAPTTLKNSRNGTNHISARTTMHQQMKNGAHGLEQNENGINVAEVFSKKCFENFWVN